MAKTLMGNRRSSIEIGLEILSVCAKGRVNKTAIMYRNNLSYTPLQRYLSLLLAQNLISRDDIGHYQLTSDGQIIMRRVENVVRTLRDLSWMLEPSMEATMR